MIKSRVIVYKVIERWNVKKAINEYGLYEATEVRYSDGSSSIYRPVQTLYTGEKDDGWFLVATGDKNWAKRTKERYMPLSGIEESLS